LFVVVVVVVVVVSLVARSSPVDAAPCWSPPLDGVVIDPFREPPCTWCAGNRGLEFVADRRGATVRAVASGRVEFAGVVARTAYVVVRLANGWRQTYGRLSSIGVASDAAVLAGTEIGRTHRELFFGLRIGDRHVDPEPYLGELVIRPRLVPDDGTAARSPSSAVLRCHRRPAGTQVAGGASRR
jgi:murein DD-endopeptidase MepM/ murein hydrolase activator NlpD